MNRLHDAIDQVLIGRVKDEKMEKLEVELSRARALIKQAYQNKLKNYSNHIFVEDAHDHVLHGTIYKNVFCVFLFYSVH